ncbi:MAG: hypothetical protein Q8J62_06680, partial [Candidatus Cloacimonadaceae bacterium]|nr:hypothetical protein [Candidatus Cloacimonadaceae bacterium]
AMRSEINNTLQKPLSNSSGTEAISMSYFTFPTGMVVSMEIYILQGDIDEKSQVWTDRMRTHFKESF